MHRSFGVCPHCTAKGLPGTVWKLNEKTPSITLSDGKSFHLILFSGPEPVRAPTGGILANRLVGQFFYVHDRMGDDAHWTAVLLTRPGESFESVKDHFERVATKLAELLERGNPLCAEYGFDGEQLWELKAYEQKLQPHCPVAIKVGQHEVHAPNHDTWGIVTCDSCGLHFHIGPNRLFGSRTTAEATARQLQAILAQDHIAGRAHLSGYELPD
jgi:hypothetical protein